MKGIPELRFKSLLPKHWRYEFMVEMDKKSIDRIEIISWLGFIMYCSLFYLDYVRHHKGLFEENPIYRYLFYIHITGLLYLVIALVIRFAKEKVKATRLSRAMIIWATVILMTGNLMGQSYFSYKIYTSLSLYMIYVLVANWTFTMNHFQRISFNLFCFIILIVGINIIEIEGEVRFLISLYEGFFFIIISFLFGTFDYNLRSLRFLEQKELEREKVRIEELELMKSKMYTNLTHEFRTPLTVIAGMAGQIHVNPSKWGEKGAQMIRRNAARILNLVNQILDLSKLESGTMSLHPVKGDVIRSLSYVIDSFQSYAEAKGIQLHFLPDIPELFLDYDADKSLTIVSNLISNAIKYTPKGGNVYVRVSQIETSSGPRLELRIRDTGIGIPEDKQKLIFDRFYQVTDKSSSEMSGTGIGLAIVRELVKLMHGNIQVNSQVGVGTEFILDFPIRNSAEVEPAQFVPDSIKSAVSSWFEEPAADELRPVLPGHGLLETTRVLIIEDNPDVAEYIASVITGEYHVTIAHDGRKGVVSALNEVPDLIITDLMMPGMDGYEVCTTLKEDDRTSHIPIIMLTAKAERDAKVAGFESGADAYIMKPFDKTELLAQMKQMIETRKQLQARYLKSAADGAAGISGSSKEERFIEKVREAVHAHLSDDAFGINHLCRAVGMGRTQLHNKLKALTGKSTSHFIRGIRLTEAQKLLKEAELTVSEVAYDTGFTDPGYFTRVFHEEVGETPSDFRRRFIPDTVE